MPYRLKRGGLVTFGQKKNNSSNPTHTPFSQFSEFTVLWDVQVASGSLAERCLKFFNFHLSNLEIKFKFQNYPNPNFQVTGR